MQSPLLTRDSATELRSGTELPGETEDPDTQPRSALPPSARHAACPLCGGGDRETVGEADRRGRPLETVLCRTCGLVSHAVIPTDDDLRRYYEHDYRLEYHGEYQPCDRRVLRADRNARRIVRQVRRDLIPRSRVLEIGAGIGCTVKALQEAGFEAFGIEPNQGFCSYSQQVLRAPVTRCRLEEHTPAEPYDAVFLVHVIEHLRDPRAAVARIRDMLFPGGLFYVECPNLAAPHAVPGRQFHYAHVYNFTPATLTMLVESCGFERVRQYGSRSNPNLQMLFRKAAPQPLRPDPASVRLSRRGIGMHPIVYHARPSYLVRRVPKLVHYLLEHLRAAGYVSRLRERAACRPVASQTPPAVS